LLYAGAELLLCPEGEELLLDVPEYEELASLLGLLLLYDGLVLILGLL
jgi:hypothetical protein